MAINKSELKEYKGYTMISKYIYRDSDLSLKAKGLLSLLFALPDDFNVTIAGIKNFTTDKDKAIKNGIAELKEKCYLTVQPVRDHGRISDWVYTPYYYPYDKEIKTESEFVEAETEDGSTNIRIEEIHLSLQTNYHLYDANLSLSAKGLLSYMFSVPANWVFNERNLAAKNADGRASVSSIIEELINNRYLDREQTKNDSGLFGRMTYTFYRKPKAVDNKEISPEVPFQATDNQAAEKPSTEKALLENARIEKGPQTNTIIKKTINTKTIESSSRKNKENTEPSRGEAKKRIEKMINLKKLSNDPVINIRYLDLLVSKMADVYMSDSDNIIVGKNKFQKKDLIKNFESLNEDDIKSLLIKVQENNPAVPGFYILTLINNGWNKNIKKPENISNKTEASYDLDAFTKASIENKLVYKKK